MRLSQKQLRQLIEAEVDKMRVPNGPNSRDDGDKDLTEDDELREAPERMSDSEFMIMQIGEEVAGYFHEVLAKHFSMGHLQQGQVGDAVYQVEKTVKNVIRDLLT